MDLIIAGDIICDVVASDVTNLPIWNTDSLAKGGILTMAGGTGLNNSVHAANYILWLQKQSIQSNIKIHIFSSTCDDTNGKICKERLNQFKPILVDHSIIPPIQPSFSNGQMNIPMLYRTSTCIVISGSKDRGFITDRGCISNLAVDWFNPSDILGFDVNESSSTEQQVNITSINDNNSIFNDESQSQSNSHSQSQSSNKLNQLYSKGKRHIHIAGYYNCTTLPIGLPDFLKQVCQHLCIYLCIYMCIYICTYMY